MRLFGNSRALSLLLIALLHRHATAQRVTGVVRDSSTSRTVPGAVLTLVDSAGQMLSRVIAGPTGEFALPRLPGTRAVRIVRIGFRPRTVTLPIDETRLDVSLVPLALSLDSLRTHGEGLCSKSSDRAAAFQLWERVRMALLSATAGDSAASTLSYFTYGRELKPANGEIIRQSVELRNGTGFGALTGGRTAGALAAYGYVHELASEPLAANSREYYFADAEVLADETFAATHCLGLIRDAKTHPEEIGLAFSPLSSRDSVADIKGVLWTSAATQDPRSMSFRYTTLEPALMIAGAGGEILFRTLPNGITFLEQWTLRTPRVSVRPGTSYRSCSVGGTDPSKGCKGGGGITIPVPATVVTASRRQEQGDLTIERLAENGGQVTLVRWSDGVTWTAQPTGVRGRMQRAGSPRVAAFAFVVPTTGSDTVVADASGGFKVVPLPAGRYRMTFADTADGRCSLVEKAVQVTAGDLADLTVELPLKARLPWRSCKFKR